MKKSKILAIALFPMAIAMLASCGNDDNNNQGTTKNYQVSEEEWNASFGTDKPYFIADNYYAKFVQTSVCDNVPTSTTSEMFIDGLKLHLKGEHKEGNESETQELFYEKKDNSFDEYHKESDKWKKESGIKENPIKEFTEFFEPFVFKNFQYDPVLHAYKCESGFIKDIGNVKNLRINFEEKKLMSMHFDFELVVESKNLNGNFDGAFTYGNQTVTLPQVEPVADSGCYLMGLGGDWEKGTMLELDTEETRYKQYKIENVSLGEGDNLKIKFTANGGEPVWAGYAQVEEGCRDLVNNDEKDGNFVIKETDNYNVYYKSESNLIWIAKVGSPTPTVSDFQIEIGGLAQDLIKNETPMEGFTEWFTVGIGVEEGTIIRFIDNTQEPAVTFDITTIDPASVAGFTVEDGSIKCVSSGTYDFYLKLKMGEDQIYIGATK